MWPREFKYFLSSVRFGAVTTSLGSLFQCSTTLGEAFFFQYPAQTSPDPTSAHSLGFCHWSAQSRDQCLPLLSPSWGSCNSNEVCPQSLPSWTDQGTSDTSHVASPISVVLLWTLSNSLMSFLHCGAHKWDSRQGRAEHFLGFVKKFTIIFNKFIYSLLLVLSLVRNSNSLLIS